MTDRPTPDLTRMLRDAFRAGAYASVRVHMGDWAVEDWNDEDWREEANEYAAKILRGGRNEESDMRGNRQILRDADGDVVGIEVTADDYAEIKRGRS